MNSIMDIQQVEAERIATKLGRPMNEDEVSFYHRRALQHDAILIARMPGILDEIAPGAFLNQARRNWEAIQTYDDEVRIARMAIIQVMADSAENRMHQRVQ